MSEKLLIIGAGVDRSRGIDFPLADTLVSDIASYIAGDGKGVDAALRAAIPGLRFSFNTMIARAVDEITARQPSEQREMVERVERAIKNVGDDQAAVRKHGELIIRLFNKLAQIAESSQLDNETEQLIREVFPADADILIDSDSILDIHKLSLSDTFKTVLKRTLRMGLNGDKHVVADALSADMLNIETLLIEKFLGFYNEKTSDVKNYLYISWCLWAYLVSKQQKVLQDLQDKEVPFYGKLPGDVRGITLNYTEFLRTKLGRERCIYFHGALAQYVRMDTRDLLAIENLAECDPERFIREVMTPCINFNSEYVSEQRHVIPALVPPLRLKPVLSQQYIDIWGDASRWIKEANHIVVVGYSFNNSDEHFNDILRNNSDKHIDVVVPEAGEQYFRKRMEKVFSTPVDQYNRVEVGGRPAFQARKVRLIPAIATDVDLGALFSRSAA